MDVNFKTLLVISCTAMDIPSVESTFWKSELRWNKTDLLVYLDRQITINDFFSQVFHVIRCNVPTFVQNAKLLRYTTRKG